MPKNYAQVYRYTHKSLGTSCILTGPSVCFIRVFWPMLPDMWLPMTIPSPRWRAEVILLSKSPAYLSNIPSPEDAVDCHRTTHTKKLIGERLFISASLVVLHICENRPMDGLQGLDGSASILGGDALAECRLSKREDRLGLPAGPQPLVNQLIQGNASGSAFLASGIHSEQRDSPVSLASSRLVERKCLNLNPLSAARNK